MRNHSQMPPLRPHTRDFHESARETLGVVLIRAREAAGYHSRPAFSRHSGIGITSLVKIESGKPVGPQVYEKYARALPGWTEDSPVSVLRGKPAPEPAPEMPEVDTVVVTSDVYQAPDPRPQIGTHEWLVHYARLLRGIDFTEVKTVLLRMIEAETRVLELEQELAELGASPTGVKSAASVQT